MTVTMLPLEHPLLSYAYKVKIAPREKRLTLEAVVPDD
jgi:hypothetical protein